MGKQVLVGIALGSDSDLPTLEEGIKQLDEFGISYEIKIVSAHRTPDDMAEFGKSARQRGLKVIIAAAGGAAHLPGMLAAHTSLPVIGVPVVSKNLSGLDSLYSIVQMPSGVPVACVAIGAGKNAAILAAQILGTSDSKIQKKLDAFKIKQAQESRAKNRKL